MLDDLVEKPKQSSLFESQPRNRGALPGAPPPDIAPLKPTPVYDTYWRFAAQRQEIFFARAGGQPPPWTDDEILATFKFTNAYRAADRVSQYLIRHVIYREDLPMTNEEVFFRTMLFKLFNKIETWELLETECGPLTWEAYNFKTYDDVLAKAMSSGQRIYSAAYIMPSAGTFGYSRTLTQTGNTNAFTADITPASYKNTVGITQNGNGNTLGLTEQGEQNSLQAQQQGNSNNMTIVQNGVGNSITYAQTGNGLTANIQQLGSVKQVVSLTQTSATPTVTIVQH